MHNFVLVYSGLVYIADLVLKFTVCNGQCSVDQVRQCGRAIRGKKIIRIHLVQLALTNGTQSAPCAFLAQFSGSLLTGGPTWLRSSPLMPSANGLLCLVIRILIPYNTGFPMPKCKFLNWGPILFRSSLLMSITNDLEQVS